MKQTKLTSKGEFRPDGNVVEAIRYWFGATDYNHAEIADEGGFYGQQQFFLSNQKEGRVEVQFRPFDLRFAALTVALGVQSSREKLDAPGLEGGLFDPNTTHSIAGYMFNELRFNATQRLQLAGRIESNTVKGTVPDLFVDPDASIWREPIVHAAQRLCWLPAGSAGRSGRERDLSACRAGAARTGIAVARRA